MPPSLEAGATAAEINALGFARVWKLAETAKIAISTQVINPKTRGNLRPVPSSPGWVKGFPLGTISEFSSA
jgi:hypothetical protein